MRRVSLDPDRPVPPLSRLRLATEILTSYARLLWTLRRRGLQVAIARARETDPASHAPGCDGAQARRLARIVTRTLRPLPTDTRCLITSLVVMEAVHRRGGHARFVIGGTTPSRDFKAHAWVEVDGAPVMPAGGDAFHRLLDA